MLHEVHAHMRTLFFSIMSAFVLCLPENENGIYVLDYEIVWNSKICTYILAFFLLNSIVPSWFMA